MADLDIQRRSNALLWIVGVVVLFLFIWLLFGWASGPITTSRPATPTPAATPLPDACDPVTGASHASQREPARGDRRGDVVSVAAMAA